MSPLGLLQALSAHQSPLGSCSCTYLVTKFVNKLCHNSEIKRDFGS